MENIDPILKEILFWLLFLFFNFSLFVFNYIIYFKEADFLPFQNLLQKNSRGVFISQNPDFFRLSVEISFLIVVFRYGLIENYQHLIIGYYCFIFVMNLYQYTFNRIYQVSPIFINDIKLLKNGLAILWSESKLKTLTIVITLTFVTLLLSHGLYSFLNYYQWVEPNYYTHVIVFLVSAYFLIGISKNGYAFANYEYQIYYRYSLHFLQIFRHISDSQNLIKLRKKFNKKELEKKRNLSITLKSKPNIHLLFIESYGSILLRDSFLKDIYSKKINTFIDNLKDEKWKCKSNLSTSISLIGPSWLAYTSVLFGKKVESNFEYENLLNDDRYHKYDTFQKSFQKQGYFSYNLNASKLKSGLSVPFESMENFYGIDQWILKKDLNYNGTKYGFVDNPPDQYTLNYAYDEYLNKQNAPYILFFLTKNSHSPFISPQKALKNWKDWDKTDDETVGMQLLKKPNFNDYIMSINYQIEVMQDFILKKGKENDIFLLIGDHQPHGISNQSHGHETIVHVISKDQNFIKGFDQYGFRDYVHDSQNPIKHESIYSIFLREFIRTYGNKHEKLPNYEPNGLQL